jgi:hypothetical protein
MVKNETLKEVKELNHTLAKAYGLGYIPKKRKATFANHKTSFVRNNVNNA